ncbi:hypothetical protein HMPREF3033_00873 [Veillonellaceae bacterium DNF00751]|uniref:Uncharacterized protein n=1 Tax=Megasphaera lornae TaxID=1000568 RepID=D3LUG2_9FIRM|nr:hypothetical protein HMPREF0889_0152 [Megasphaera genomosp. type_1 str. 28L]KXB92029.1 hypothetical protein HMPREF3033_00873 [Veillonellaceae bacterium DNF00751]
MRRVYFVDGTCSPCVLLRYGVITAIRMRGRRFLAAACRCLFRF